MSEALAKALEEKKGDRSLRALARDLDVAVGTAEGWLNGWRTPEIAHIARLAVYLEVDPCVIMRWELDELNPDLVCSLNKVPLSRRQTVDYRRHPTVRAHETTDWDARPIDVYATDASLRVA